MQLLYHHPVCPLSRQARIYLTEFNKEFRLVKEGYGSKEGLLIKLNPIGELPILHLDSIDYYLVGIYSIIEYMLDTQENFYFMPQDVMDRAEVRKYINWFNSKFYREVSKILVNEKIIRLLMHQGAPRSNYIMLAKSNLSKHFNFLTNLLEKNTYIMSEKISCADIAAAAHISVIDYLGEINWDSWVTLKEWYSIIKSRPAFQPILQDRIAGFLPSRDYSNLDF